MLSVEDHVKYLDGRCDYHQTMHASLKGHLSGNCCNDCEAFMLLSGT